MGRLLAKVQACRLHDEVQPVGCSKDSPGVPGLPGGDSLWLPASVASLCLPPGCTLTSCGEPFSAAMSWLQLLQHVNSWQVLMLCSLSTSAR